MLESGIGKGAMRKLSPRDPRLGKLVRMISLDATNLAEALTTGPLRQTLRTERIEAIAEAICAAGRHAQGMSLTEEIESISNSKGNNIGVLLRLGLLGKDPITLQEAGMITGVTRERIRQKEKKLKDLIQTGKPYTPAVDRVMSALDEAVGNGVAYASEIERALHLRGVLSANESLGQASRFAQLKGATRYEIESCDGRLIIARPIRLKRFTYFLAVVREELDRLTKDFGAIPLSGLRDALEQKDLQDIIASLPLALDIMGDEVEWFEHGTWLRNRRKWSRIANLAMKVLSIAPSIRIGELRKGIQRHHRITYVPPSQVLGKMLVSDLKLMDVSFDGTFAKAAKPREPSSVLASLEFSVFEILKAHDDVMTRADLEAETKKQRMPGGSFHVAIGYSPIFDCLTKGVYAIRGACVPPGVVESLGAKAKVVRTLLERDYGHVPDGRIYLVQELSQFAFDKGMFNRPVGLKAYVDDGVYRIIVDGRRTPYEVRCSSDQIRFSAHALETVGAEAGDFALLVFDGAKGEVELIVGDAGVADKLAVPASTAEILADQE